MVVVGVSGVIVLAVAVVVDDAVAASVAALKHATCTVGMYAGLYRRKRGACSLLLLNYLSREDARSQNYLLRKVRWSDTSWDATHPHSE